VAPHRRIGGRACARLRPARRPVALGPPPPRSPRRGAVACLRGASGL